jgi:type II secretory pathway predicted ATPase ExeA
MIRAHFGLQKNPFEHNELPKLLAHQQEVMDILLVHAQQGGLCLILGESGVGKSVLKQAILQLDPKRYVMPVVNRTLHTWHNTLRILCEAFQVEFQCSDHKCERLLVTEAYRLHRTGKLLMPVIDDAHLMPSECLRKLRLLLEDFPRTHNLVLIGQPPLLQTLSLSINEEIKSRVTYSVALPRLSPEAIEAFILDSLDQAGMGHNTFTPEALGLIVRSGEGLLRRTKNLCLGSLVQAVRDQTRCVDLKQVNRVLLQPHWRKDCDAPLV